MFNCQELCAIIRNRLFIINNSYSIFNPKYLISCAFSVIMKLTKLECSKDWLFRVSNLNGKSERYGTRIYSQHFCLVSIYCLDLMSYYNFIRFPLEYQEIWIDSGQMLFDSQRLSCTETITAYLHIILYGSWWVFLFEPMYYIYSDFQITYNNLDFQIICTSTSSWTIKNYDKSLTLEWCEKIII